MQLKNTPIQKVTFNQFDIFIKRDDLLDKEFSGNKARKFLYFLENNFEGISKIISYGSAQSNAMYSLSVLAKLKGLYFDFYVDHIATYLKENPQGNYAGARENGANIIEGNNFNDGSFIIPSDVLFIPEGGRDKRAEYGIKKLANEILQWIEDNSIKKELLKVMLPSGTGTTALFLSKNLEGIEVLTCACVGDENYLERQFFELEDDKNFHPTILKKEKKYHFGKLYKEFYEVYKSLQEQTDIEFELLYDPLGFITLQQYLQENNNNQVLYIHQGGLKGNETMKQRYKRKYD